MLFPEWGFLTYLTLKKDTIGEIITTCIIITSRFIFIIKWKVSLINPIESPRYSSFRRKASIEFNLNVVLHKFNQWAASNLKSNMSSGYHSYTARNHTLFKVKIFESRKGLPGIRQYMYVLVIWVKT